MRIPTNLAEFEASLSLEYPPGTWAESLKAMWWDAQGNWERSHEIAQDINSNLGNWIHAYLHRKEGDEWNAGYWYRRAGQAFPKKTLAKEFQDLLLFVLGL